MEELFLILITNKQSNILQDIETLSTFSRAVTDLCSTLDKKEVDKHAFEIIAYFDEIVTMGGYQESISQSQIKTIIGITYFVVFKSTATSSSLTLLKSYIIIIIHDDNIYSYGVTRRTYPS